MHCILKSDIIGLQWVRLSGRQCAGDWTPIVLIHNVLRGLIEPLRLHWNDMSVDCPYCGWYKVWKSLKTITWNQGWGCHGQLRVPHGFVCPHNRHRYVSLVYIAWNDCRVASGLRRREQAEISLDVDHVDSDVNRHYFVILACLLQVESRIWRSICSTFSILHPRLDFACWLLLHPHGIALSGNFRGWQTRHEAPLSADSVASCPMGNCLNVVYDIGLHDIQPRYYREFH